MIDVFPALFDNYFIKIIFLVHATLFSLANIAVANDWGSNVYTTYHLIFLISLLMAILVDENANIVLVSTAFNAICVVLDIIMLIATTKYFGFITTLTLVINLLCRPVSTLLLLKNYSARAGVEDPTGGLLEVNVPAATVPRARSAYQNIDEPSQTLP